MKPIKPDVANLSVTTHGSVSWTTNAWATSSSRRGCRPPRRVTRSPRTSSATTAWWIYERVAQGMAATQKSGVLELSFVTDQAMTGVSRKTPP